MQARSSAALGALLGAALGFAAGSAWAPRDAPPPPAPRVDAAVDASVAELRAERDRLADRVAQLSAERDDLGAALAEQEAPPETPPAAADDAEAQAEAERRAALEAAGWLPVEIDRLQREFEAYEMERLYLRDQATREGWRGSARFRREQRGLLEDLRSELGDEDYDAALYADGRQNRAVVFSLLEDSPAQTAGVREGDEILSYAGERIFDPIRLVRLTVAGQAGRPVELRVLRDGEEIRLFVPRGPLGARLRPASRPPFRP